MSLVFDILIKLLIFVVQLFFMRTKILMPQNEPSDRELRQLMKEVLLEVKENTVKTKILIKNSILLEIQKIKSKSKK
jgi:hypothetical protein